MFLRKVFKGFILKKQMKDSEHHSKSEHHSPEHHHESKKDTIDIPVGKSLTKLRNNPWITSTIVLAVVLVVVIVMNGGISGNNPNVSSDVAAQNVITFLNSNPNLAAGGVNLVSSVREGELYKVTLKYQGQDVPIYATLDGKFLVSSIVPLSGDAGTATDGTDPNSQPQPQDIPKSNKPKVELFVMSYCPYGTQMEKAILPVIAALKDKIDFELEFTHFTLHGEKEDTENFRQICIREEQKDKFLPYIQCILDSDDQSNPKDVNQCMKDLKISTTKVDSCIKNKAEGYYKIDSDLSKKYGVQGSPTLVINGVQADAARNPASILSTICSAFNDAPSECDAVLPSESTSPGFGYSASNTAESAAIKCGV